MAGKLTYLTKSLLNVPQFITAAEYEGVKEFLENRNSLKETIQLAELEEKMAARGGSRSRERYSVENGIATLHISGALSHKATWMDALCGASSYESLASIYDEMISDSAVETIVLQVNSGGGEARGCFEFARHLHDAKPDNVRLIAYTDSMAASAAYAIASVADEVIVSTDASVGSIGVISQLMTMQGKLEQGGMKVHTFTAGKGKDLGNPTRDMTEDEQATIQARIDGLYEGFVNHVAEMRGLEEDHIVKNLGADMFSGQDAVEKGLADKVMTAYQFADYLADLADQKNGSPKSSTKMETPTLDKDNLETPVVDANAELIAELQTKLAEAQGKLDVKAEEERLAKLASLEEKASAWSAFGVDAKAYAEAAMSGSVPVEMFDALAAEAEAKIKETLEATDVIVDASTSMEELGDSDVETEISPEAAAKQQLRDALKAKYN